MGVWGLWERWISAVRAALATTGAWLVRDRVWGTSRSCRSPQGAESWLPPAHLQEASESDQLRPTEPGSGASRVRGSMNLRRHDRRWEQQLQRAHHLKKKEGAVSPPRPMHEGWDEARARGMLTCSGSSDRYRGTCCPQGSNGSERKTSLHITGNPGKEKLLLELQAEGPTP